MAIIFRLLSFYGDDSLRSNPFSLTADVPKFAERFSPRGNIVFGRSCQVQVGSRAKRMMTAAAKKRKTQNQDLILWTRSTRYKRYLDYSFKPGQEDQNKATSNKQSDIVKVQETKKMNSVQSLGRVISRAVHSSHTALSGTTRSTTIYARRPLSSMLRLQVPVDTSDGSISRSESTLWRIQGSQKRTVVMVTKSKSSELPVPNETNDDASSKSSSDAASYKFLSEDLVITPSCLARVEKLVQQRKAKDGCDYFLRVFVDAGGCSGFQYQFEFDQQYDADEDIVLAATSSDNKPRVVVDENSLEFLKGSKLDFVQEMIRSSFAVIDNPQSESACGCGSSFAVKNFSSNPALD